jgi:hypothetical protein
VIGLLNISCQKWKKYCAEENLDFRILLISDNASAHMPLRTPVMQSMDQV